MEDLASRLYMGFEDVEGSYDYQNDLENSRQDSESKYKYARQNLKPLRKRDRSQHPLSQASLFSYMTYHFMTGFVLGVYRAGVVQVERLWRCPKRDGARHNARRLQRLWALELDERGVQRASVFRVMLRFIRTRLIVTSIVQLFTLSFNIIGPAFLVKWMLEYNSDASEPRPGYGLALVAAYAACEICKCFCFATQWLINYQTAMRLRGAVLELVYLKLLRLRSLQDKTVGHFVNVFTNDGQRLIEACASGPMVLGGPVMAVAATAYCCWVLSAWALLGTLFFALFYPYQFIVARLTAYLRRLAIHTTDKRVRLMVEILTYIKLIKLYAWERAFAAKIQGIRREEGSLLEKAAFVQTMSVAFLPMVPVFASVITFIAHTLAGNPLSPAQAFSVMSVFLVMRQRILGPLTGTTKSLSEVIIASRRIKDILTMEERAAVRDDVTDGDLAVELRGASLAWDAVRGEQRSAGDEQRSAGDEQRSAGDEQREVTARLCETSEHERAVLNNIHFSAKRGELVGVCGAVGSGKSSLLAAILNQMVQRAGSIAVAASIAYVPQQAWIMNKTLQENILFGQAFNKERYALTLQRCNLLPDLEMLPGGDLTEIGERGINLSGGQKQRVSLARAVYCDRELYLLDDPLSAVDPQVGQHLFKHCIRGVLRDKTVIFVTHQLQYLPQCDRIVLMRDGCIHEDGTHAQLMQHKGEYAALIDTYHRDHAHPGDDGQHEDTLDSVDTQAVLLARKASQNLCGQQRLIEKERVETGQVTHQTYMAYFRAAGGLIMIPLVLVSFALPVAVAAFSNWWLSYWIAQGDGREASERSGNSTVTEVTGGARDPGPNLGDNPSVHMYVSVYACTAVLVVVTLCARGYLFMKVTLGASTRLHDQVFSKVLRSPMHFFDTTPLGRILNRFSKDQDDVDTKLPMHGQTLLQNSLLVITSLVVICVVFPFFLLPVIPIAIVFFILYRMFRVVLREVKRADNVSRSPWISHITTSIQGLHTINAYSCQAEFISKFEELTDANTVLHFLLYYVMRWLAVRLDLLAIVITSTTALLVVLAKGHVEPAYAGLAIAYAAQVSAMFQITIRLLLDVQVTFTSVQRIHSYILHVETEAPSVMEACRPPPSWPRDGRIEIHDYCMRYRPGLPLVLRNVTCSIRPCEKVGIVGRTGSGKSSLGVALFRLVEASAGRIVVDSLDISALGLDDLRSRLAIIPQDPVLFVGTLRYNLDPFDEHEDAAVWNALEQCHIKDLVTELEGHLGATVLENGENFSVGERQLFCMARALLRHSKILMLDEATAAIDTETDAKIQSTIKQAFSDCTLLTIAHRLHTVLACDRILVLSHGQIVEFAEPEALLKDKESVFYGMVHPDTVQH